MPTSTLDALFAWPVDWPIFLFFAALLALEAYSFGSTRTSAISIAFPLTYVVVSWLPTTFLLSAIMRELSDPAAQAAVFAIIFIGIYFVVHRMLFSFGTTGGSIPEALISGVGVSIIVLVFWLQTPGLKELWLFGPQIQYTFGETLRTWWLLGVFAALAYTRG